jgi:CheY-like chemotaxis protein
MFVGRKRMSHAAPTDCPPAVSPEPLGHPLYDARKHADGLRIIVADDYQDGARSLALLLRHWGVDAEPCCSGPEVLNAASASPPDAILSEIWLPQMDGVSASHLRRRVELQKTLLVAVTGWTDRKSRRLAEGAGFDFFYVKPLDLASLQEILAEVRRFKEGLID